MTMETGGDPAMWQQIGAALGRIAMRYVEWLESILPIVLPAVFATYLMGRHQGFKGAALRLYMATGIFFAIIGVPVILVWFGLDGEVWTRVLTCAVSVYCYKIFVWGELYVARRLNIDRRKPPEDESGHGDGE